MLVWWVGKKNFLLLKIIARKTVEKLLHKSIWVGATYLCHSGTHTEQDFKKWKSFSIKSSAHGQQSHKPTEGPESLSALCAISIPGLSLNALIRYLGKKNKKGTRTTLQSAQFHQNQFCLKGDTDAQVKIESWNLSHNMHGWMCLSG